MAVPTPNKPRPAGPQTPDNLPRFVPAQHAKQVLRVTLGAGVMLGALAAALGGGAVAKGSGSRSTAGAGDGGGGGDPANSEGAFLVDVELERDALAKRGRGRGDRSRTWWWPYTRHVDRFSRNWPSRLAAISPVVGRVSIDSDYLRAMFGGLSLLLYPIGVVLGLLAAASTGGLAVPPALGWFIAILALAMFDSMAGYIAGIAFAAYVVFAGGIVSPASVREVFGIVLVWFATPLAAGAVRPLRRNTKLHLPGIWDRSADFVLGGLFGGWLASNMTEQLSLLGGVEVPIAHQKWTIALVVIGLLAIRMILETIAAHHYPDRLQAVAHEGDLESSTLQVGLSLIIQVALFVFIARAYMSWGWPLLAGAVIFYTPLVPWLFADRLPKSKRVAKWMPLGLAKWSFVIIAGVALSWLIQHVASGPKSAENLGFMFLTLPILICWGCELFVPEEVEAETEGQDEERARGIAHETAGAAAAEEDGAPETRPDEDETWHPDGEGGRFPMTWPLRLAGVPAMGLCVYLVLSGLAGG